MERVAADTGARERGRRAARLALRVALLLKLPLIALWLALGSALAAIVGRVTDWFVMTDELLYERLAIGVARTGSPIPRIHGELVPNVNQLYPLLIAPLYRHGLVPEALHEAHVLNAFVMSSACIPAYLLARRISGRRAPALLVALLSVCLPWIVLSSFLLTEVAAYPAFLWALLGMQASTTAPGLRNDLLALLALALATAARAQLLVLAVVFPVALILHALVAEPWPWRLARLRSAGRRLLSRHRLLAAVYLMLALLALALATAGRLASVLGTYAATTHGNLLPGQIGRAFAEHFASLAPALGILPFLIGVAWLLAGLVRPAGPEIRAFAAVGTATLLGLWFEVGSYDLRFGGGIVRDRYLFYAVPIVLIAFAGAICDRRWPRWSLLAPTALLVLGLAFLPLPRFSKLNVDTPLAVLNDRLIDLSGSPRAARLFLALAAAVLALLFLQASLLLRRGLLTALLVALAASSLAAETGYAFGRLFRVDGTSGRPLTLDQGVVFDWVDRELGREASVSILPYPMLHGDYWASVAFWWDMEFWNISVGQSLLYNDHFYWTPDTFPKPNLRLDPRTGRASLSPSEYIAESAFETRFGIAGRRVALERNVALIRAAMPWHAAWMSFGLSDDGWTRPGRAAIIRIFPGPGQTRPVTRYLTLWIQAPQGVDARRFVVGSNLDRWRGSASWNDAVSGQLRVCVPAQRPADVRVRTGGTSVVYGDPQSSISIGSQRTVGVLVAAVSLADEVSPGC
jgi:hypothetical protein